MTEWREECVQCGEAFASRSKTNFCTKCCHDGLDEDLREEFGFFVESGDESDNDSPQLDLGQPSSAQAGLGDFA